ncbi:HEAT repeat domain-containing protein [Viridibacterium curvum]
MARAIPEELLYVPIVVGMNAPDCERTWCEEKCLALVSHPDFTVRGNAILGLGHIARTCRALDIEKAVPAIQTALNDPHPYVRGHADSAACDLQVYLGYVVPGYDTQKTEDLYDAIQEVLRKNSSV